MPWDPYENHRPNPCKDCPDRYPACSARCKKPEHVKWVAEQEKIREARKNYRVSIYAKRETVQRKR